MLAVTGYGTTIVKELSQICGETIMRINYDDDELPIVDRYLFAGGVLYNKSGDEQTFDEWLVSVRVNFTNVVRMCEQIFMRKEPAAVCVIGSQSARTGSFDGTYAAAKRAIHDYVEARSTTRGHRLVCVAPTIIADSGMTRRRHDYPQVLKERRTVTARQVAEVVYRLLYQSDQTNIIEAV